MITIEEIHSMLVDVENDRVERTISTTNTDKFGQAICAFANDLPNHNQPGYLFLGVEDEGSVKGLDVTDELLKNIAAIRTDGNIQPQPSMVVQKVTMPEGDYVSEEKLTSKTDISEEKLTSKTDISEEKLTSRLDFPTLMVRNVYELIKMNRKIKYSQMEDNLGVAERTIARAIDWLKENGYINPEKSKVKGEWQLL